MPGKSTVIDNLIMPNGRKTMNKIKYSMLIQWSDQDNCFLVSIPDFPGQKWRTHGNTYEEAVMNGKKVLESLIISYESDGESLPQPHIYTMIS